MFNVFLETRRSIGWPRVARGLARSLALCGMALGAAQSHTATSSPPAPKGDGITDDTSALQALLDQAGKLATGKNPVLVKLPSAVYLVNPTVRGASDDGVMDYGLRLHSNMTLDLTGVCLRAKPNGNDNYSILTIGGCSNVTVIGDKQVSPSPGSTWPSNPMLLVAPVSAAYIANLTGDYYSTNQQGPWAHTGSTGQGGIGLTVRNANKVLVQNITARCCWGDGFYVQGGTGLTFDRVWADTNRRQGMSVVAGNIINIINSIFSNTKGTLPECGIDVEPNAVGTVYGLNIKSCNFYHNNGSGLQMSVRNELVGTITNIYSTVVQNNYFSYNGFSAAVGSSIGGIYLSNIPGQATKTVKFNLNNSYLTDINNNFCDNNYGYGILAAGGSNICNNLNISSNTINNNINGLMMYLCFFANISSNTINGISKFNNINTKNKLLYVSNCTDLNGAQITK